MSHELKLKGWPATHLAVLRSLTRCPNIQHLMSTSLQQRAWEKRTRLGESPVKPTIESKICLHTNASCRILEHRLPLNNIELHLSLPNGLQRQGKGSQISISSPRGFCISSKWDSSLSTINFSHKSQRPNSKDHYEREQHCSLSMSEEIEVPISRFSWKLLNWRVDNNKLNRARKLHRTPWSLHQEFSSSFLMCSSDEEDQSCLQVSKLFGSSTIKCRTAIAPEKVCTWTAWSA